MTGIIRDFSQTSIDKIAALVQKEEDDGQWGIADWFDDTFTSAGDIQDSLSQLDKYHRDVIDDQNIGVEKFNNILKEIEVVDQNYASRFYNLYDKLEGLNDKLVDIGNMITPAVIATSQENFTKITTGVNEIFNSVLSGTDQYMNDLEGSIEVVLEEEPGFLQKIGSGALGIGVSIVQDVAGPVLTTGEDIFHQWGIGNGFLFEDSLESMDEAVSSLDWIDEQWYYGGRVIGDGASVVIGVVGIVEGIGMVGAAAGMEGVGLVSAIIPGVGEITFPVITVAAAAVAVSGVAVAGVGAGAVFAGAGNIKDNWMKMESSGRGSYNSPGVKNIYNSIREAPNYPKGFEGRQNGTVNNEVKNKKRLAELREIESGKWRKVYKDGFDVNGNKISIHYFQSATGKVFSVKVKSGWSN
ncbi:hypothetical protein [Listeria booriae]|uniref:hypothetical protein n=1 Tax=Listeria booriae TaxID=1552123 RepID=UPI00162AE2AF|nr:hypothetical protein [Listeria booriae]MBC1504079.1 hypothetical protein [Listeria booriae]